MNAPQIISTWRTRCQNVTTQEWSDANALNLANIAYQLTLGTLRSRVDEDFGADIFVRDLITGQSEYSFDTRGDDTNLRTPITKVTKVALQYRFGGGYRFADVFSTSTQEEDDTQLATSVPATSPLYKISDYSIKIYPTPTQTVSGGLKVYGLYDPIPLTLATEEANIVIPPSHHWVITSHMRWLYYEAIKQESERSTAYDQAIIDETRMVTELSNRTNGQILQTAPSLQFFS